MKRFFIFLLVASGATAAFAQSSDTAKKTSDWYIKGLGGLNFSQTALVNWSAGGDNTVSANVYLNMQAGYQKGHWAWDNTLNTQFGMMYTTQNKWNKSVDNLQLTSKLGYTRNEKLFFSVLADFTTQYTKGYKNVGDDNYISNFMSPGYLNIALGADYHTWGDILSIFYSPITERFTFVKDDSLSQAGTFGVDPGKHLKAQAGMYAKISLDWKVHSNIQILSTLNLFTAYDKTFGNVVADWSTLINMKITKHLTSSLNFALKYDDSIKTVDDNGNPAGAKVQFKEILGIGLSYSF